MTVAHGVSRGCQLSFSSGVRSVMENSLQGLNLLAMLIAVSGQIIVAEAALARIIHPTLKRD